MTVRKKGLSKGKDNLVNSTLFHFQKTKPFFWQKYFSICLSQKGRRGTIIQIQKMLKNCILNPRCENALTIHQMSTCQMTYFGTINSLLLRDICGQFHKTYCLHYYQCTALSFDKVVLRGMQIRRKKYYEFGPWW